MATLGLIITGLGIVEIAISSLLRYLTIKNGVASIVAGGSLIFTGCLGMMASRLVFNFLIFRKTVNSCKLEKDRDFIFMF